jgi:hypothetical protein
MNYTNTTNLHSDINKNSKIKNKGFLFLDTIFQENKWQLVQNEMNYISYCKFGDETSSFDIKIVSDKIIVSVPIKNSMYQYVTSFKTYYEASEYIEQKFCDYIT